jgi:hypothetical protein
MMSLSFLTFLPAICEEVESVEIIDFEVKYRGEDAYGSLIYKRIILRIKTPIKPIRYYENSDGKLAGQLIYGDDASVVQSSEYCVFMDQDNLHIFYDSTPIKYSLPFSIFGHEHTVVLEYEVVNTGDMQTVRATKRYFTDMEQQFWLFLVITTIVIISVIVYRRKIIKIR